MVGVDPTVNFMDVAVPATVQVSTPVVSATVPEATSCQARMLCPADDAMRLAEDPVPATATD